MNRRGFIKSFGALAALAVTPALAKLRQTDAERLIEAMRTGVVSDQTFVLTEPLTIDIPNLTITRCRFIFKGLPLNGPMVIFGEHASGGELSYCSLHYST